MTSFRPIESEQKSNSNLSNSNMNYQNSANKLPRDAQVVVNMFREAGVTDYDPKCVQQILEFIHNYTTTILEDARMYANYAKKKNVDADDLKLAINSLLNNSYAKPPSREILLSLASERNALPLPAIKPHCGIRLPQERYCLLQAEYALASAKQKGKGSGGMNIQSKPILTKAAMKNIPQQSRPSNIVSGVSAVIQSSMGGGNTVANSGINFNAMNQMNTGNKFLNQQSMGQQMMVKEENSNMMSQSMDTL